ncbi:hypothetical protein ACFSHT_20910 [Paraburkholderia silviterrae]|uniref:Uncharacterized protein n=1 Tax=Paraburkholderia silviterrae TaxID=2528715 RepID=A0A4R5LZV6_9BURK|nr:hypothetical protein [Paraburkholderia silviterrae]TDG18188.1 hypothetical protein EYW47_35410 [Paraburkholderia silviterrae]
MSQRQTAFVSFYDEHSGQVKFCVVPRQFVQSAIDRVMTISVPPDAPEHSDIPFTDEDARKLGGMAILAIAGANPELQARLQITTEVPMEWTPPEPPAK